MESKTGTASTGFIKSEPGRIRTCDQKFKRLLRYHCATDPLYVQHCTKIYLDFNPLLIQFSSLLMLFVLCGMITAVSGGIY
jgi:hypothetical protein